jgi:hypothetical protein
MPSRKVSLSLIALAALAAFALRPLTPIAPATAQPPAPKADPLGKVVLPYLAKHCLSCHGEMKQRAGLALHTFTDEASLVKQRKLWQNVLQMVNAGEMPPRGRPRPDLKDTETFLKTVKAVFDHADRSAGLDPGRVTMRRLNRAEYNNTVRDLVGVDFNPAEDFPSDDVGHGFDNIGDVLTLSPILMERYLAAAEAITQRAIVVDPAKPSVRYVSARYLEPAGRDVPKTRFRPLTDGRLHSLFGLSMGGDFKVRSRAYADPAGGAPVRVALLDNGKELKTFGITPTEPKKAQLHEILVPLEKGQHRIAVALLDPGPAGGKRAVHVEHLAVEGPMDTRPESHRKLLAHAPGLDNRSAAREILTRFATRAFRRPATADEVDRLLKVFDQSQARGDRWEAGLRLAFQAVLVSPKFLFRIELDDRPDERGPHAINDYQMASRLSYFLWSSMPDDELLALAAKKALGPNLDAQVRRMLLDPKAYALVENFMAQWLQLRLLKNVSPDAKTFPEFDEPLRQAMQRETELFFETILREDRSVLDLIDGNFTFLNERLARHYGIADTKGNRHGQKNWVQGGRPIPWNQFVRVELQPGDRGGILTQASVLTVTSNPTRTSPVKRGRWVLEQILGTPPPPPPPDVPELPADEKAVKSASLRQRLEQHRANPSCASCHARMDPIGFAFENYNAIGRFRTRDGDFPIDPSGTLPDGKSFQGAGELKAILKGKRDLFARCLTEKMLTYALGRGLEHYDGRAVEGVIAALARNDFRFSTLVAEIVKSDPFRLRRGKDQNP